jgi:hypothetical protein
MGYGLGDRGIGFHSRQGKIYFFFYTACRPALGPTNLSSNGYWGLFPWGKATRVWNWPLTSSSAEVKKNCGAITPLPIRFHGVALHELSVGITLPYHTTFLYNCCQLHTIDSKGFWRWCIAHRIIGFLDLFHRPVFYGMETRRFGNWICFRPQLRGEDTQLGPLERAILNHCFYSVDYRTMEKVQKPSNSVYIQ